MSRAYSGIPVEGKKTWVVPRLVKEIFVAFAVVSIAVVAISKGVQHWGGKLARAAGALEADELPAAQAPAFKLPLHDGKTLDLAQYRGKVVLLNFWATWCPPCREEEPSLRKLASSLDPAKFEIVAVSVDDDWDAIDKYFAGAKPPYTVALDRGAEVSQRYGTTKFPESYLIDETGKLRLKFVGPRNWTDGNVYSLLSALGVDRKS
jgi:cytochrome c biogenesis protein CcmG, thiol:disulfide interchange protein DsbE